MSLYFDWNATTPPLGDVIAAMAEAARESWANPSSVHAAGRRARARVEDAREAIAKLMGADARDVVLTSGGTEANNIAVRSAFPVGVGGALVTSRLEHPSITRVAEALAREGRAEVRWVRVREDGMIDLEDLERALAPRDARLVAMQAVNHETGVVQPIAEVLALAKRHGARTHVDAVQAVGRIAHAGGDPSQAADTRSVAAHKLRGPKGIGALVARQGVHLEPLLAGGSQERGLRPGTLDPVAAAGFAVAATYAMDGPARYVGVAARRDALERGLLAADPRARINGSAARAPHVTNVWCPAWSGPELVAALDLDGLAVSSGSACSAGTNEPSPVIAAMFDDARATSSVRFSMGDATTDEDVAAALAIFARVVARSRARAPDRSS